MKAPPVSLMLKLGNDARQAAQVTEQLAQAVGDAGWPAAARFRVATCLSEALTNVLRHAEIGRTGVALRLRLSTRGLVLRIRDRGRAFDAPDPEMGTGCEIIPETTAVPSENGRGLAILSRWCDAQRRYRRDGLNTHLLLFTAPLAG